MSPDLLRPGHYNAWAWCINTLSVRAVCSSRLLICLIAKNVAKSTQAWGPANKVTVKTFTLHCEGSLSLSPRYVNQIEY